MYLLQALTSNLKITNTQNNQTGRRENKKPTKNAY